MSHEHRHNPERYYDDEGEVYADQRRPILKQCSHCYGTGWSAGKERLHVPCGPCHGTGLIEWSP